MKKVLIGLTVALMAVSSFGGLYVLWGDGYGFLSGADTDKYIFSDSATTQVIWDLVYTTSDSVATPTLNTSTGAIDFGSDVLVSERVGTPNSDLTGGSADVTDVLASASASDTPLTYEEYGNVVGANSPQYSNSNPGYSSGNLYAAIFQYTSSGDVYYSLTSILTPNWANDGMAPPDECHFSFEGDTQLSLLGTVSQIPEPATMSLLGIGALAMVLRRKLRK